MHWFTAFVLFTLIWWTVLFAVLPWGTRPVEGPDADAGGWRGAPAKPMIARKMIATTLIATILWAGAMMLVRSDYLSFRPGQSVTGD